MPSKHYGSMDRLISRRSQWKWLLFFLIITTTSVYALVENDAYNILNDFRNYYPSEAEVNLTSGRILKRNKIPNSNAGEILTVQDFSGDRYRQLTLSDDVYRLKWSPLGNAISYFTQEPKTNLRHLFIWNLRDNYTRNIPIPQSFAQREVKWSPDANHLAFISTSHALISVDIKSQKYSAWPGDYRSFDWSNQSDEMVAIWADGRPRIDFFRPNGKVPHNTINIDGEQQLRDVAWASASRVLVRGWDPDSRYHFLTAIDPESKMQERLLATQTPISDVGWLGNTALYYGVNDGLETEVRIVDLTTRTERSLGKNGAISITGCSPEHQSVVGVRVSPHDYEIIRISADGSISRVSGSSGVPGISHRRLMVKSRDGRTFSAWISKTQSPNLGAVVIVSGGTSVHIGPERWAETQVYLARGISVVHAPNSKGNGAEDLLALCAYLTTEESIPSSKIALVGASSAAGTILRSIQLRQSEFAVASLTGLVGDVLNKKCSNVEGLRVFLFHGGADRVIPSIASEQILRRAMTTDALHKLALFRKIFPGEDHGLHKDESRCFAIYKVIDALL